jgi:hypothetical protein
MHQIIQIHMYGKVFVDTNGDCPREWKMFQNKSVSGFQ